MCTLTEHINYKYIVGFYAVSMMFHCYLCLSMSRCISPTARITPRVIKFVGTGTLGGFGTLGQTTGAFGLAKPTTGFGATTTGFSTGLSGLGAATAQQPQQPVQLARSVFSVEYLIMYF